MASLKAANCQLTTRSLLMVYSCAAHTQNHSATLGASEDRATHWLEHCTPMLAAWCCTRRALSAGQLCRMTARTPSPRRARRSSSACCPGNPHLLLGSCGAPNDGAGLGQNLVDCAQGRARVRPRSAHLLARPSGAPGRAERNDEAMLPLSLDLSSLILPRKEVHDCSPREAPPAPRA